MHRILGWVKPTDNKRLFKSVAKFRIIGPLPASVDLRPVCPPVVDQGDLGSCTANALAGAWGFLEEKERLIEGGIPTGELFKPGQFIPASRLFLYYQERNIENDINRDGGALISDGIRSLMTVGCCDENVWPYLPQQFNMKPSPPAYQEAAKHKIMNYGSLETLDDMKHCLASGLPFVFGFTVYEEFESSIVASTGILPMPSIESKIMGGHAVMCCGYDDSSRMVIVRNSYGTSWGFGGYFMMPYEYISNSKLCDEIFVISK